MDRDYTHGVVTETALLYRRENTTRKIALQSNDLATLTRIATTMKLHTLWVVPGTPLSRESSERDVRAMEAQGYEVRASYPIRGRGKLLERAIVWKQEGTREERNSTAINFPEHSLWSWTCTDGPAILACVHYLEKQYPISISKGPAMGGRELLQELLKGKRSAWLQSSKISLDTLPYQETGKDLAFKGRAIVYRPGLWIHAYDKNAMYLGAATGAYIGEGTPEYFADSNQIHTPDLRKPGLWRCAIETGATIYNGLDMPSPLYRDQAWMTTPLLKLCMDIGWLVSPLEGYQWATCHRTLEDWGNALWTGRQSFKLDTEQWKNEQGRLLAEYSSKRLATAGLGLFNSVKSLEYAPELYRPDIWAGIVELSKERIIRKAIQIERLTGMRPTCITVDEIDYTSLESDPQKAVPTLTERSTALGGYKHSHSVLLTQSIVDELNAATSAGNFARIIRQHDQKVG